MDQGWVNGIGTHEELLQNNEIYRDVYQSQLKGGTEESAVSLDAGEESHDGTNTGGEA